mmetsp:Transcript_20363/g.22882  ORF Transcript_20363/g.22882 Transcript_20363/m.22882 type:complete len:140 (+) Transcript_20363:2-421(+)
MVVVVVVVFGLRWILWMGCCCHCPWTWTWTCLVVTISVCQPPVVPGAGNRFKVVVTPLMKPVTKMNIPKKNVGPNQSYYDVDCDSWQECHPQGTKQWHFLNSGAATSTCGSPCQQFEPTDDDWQDDLFHDYGCAPLNSQ